MVDDHAEQVTDEELAVARHARFGELPSRVQPAELVESVDAGSQQDVPPPAGDAQLWALRWGGAGA